MALSKQFRACTTLAAISSLRLNFKEFEISFFLGAMSRRGKGFNSGYSTDRIWSQQNFSLHFELKPSFGRADHSSHYDRCKLLELSTSERCKLKFERVVSLLNVRVRCIKNSLRLLARLSVDQLL